MIFACNTTLTFQDFRIEGFKVLYLNVGKCYLIKRNPSLDQIKNVYSKPSRVTPSDHLRYIGEMLQKQTCSVCTGL